MTMTSLGKVLATLRKLKGGTQESVAAAIGISRSHLAGLESDATGAGRHTLAALGTFYGVSVDMLINAETSTPIELGRGLSGQTIERDGPEENSLVRDWLRSIGQRMTVVLRARAPGVPLEDVATYLRWPLVDLQGYLAGNAEIPATRIITFCLRYSVPADYVLSGELAGLDQRLHRTLGVGGRRCRPERPEARGRAVGARLGLEAHTRSIPVHPRRHRPSRSDGGEREDIGPEVTRVPWRILCPLSRPVATNYAREYDQGTTGDSAKFDR